MRTMLVALALCTVVSTVDARYVYRWVDGGVEHYSDIEQPGAQRVWLPDDAKTPGGSTTPRSASDSGAEESAESTEDPEVRKSRCTQKKEQLKQYQSSTRIVERNHLGEDHEYTPAERDKLLAATAAEVESLCGPAP